MTYQSRIYWLRGATAAILFFGVLMSLSVVPTISEFTKVLLDLIFWPLDGKQQIIAPEFKFVLAISGGILIGWGLLIWQLTSHLFEQDPLLFRNLIWSSIGIWFVVDSLGSIATGAGLNVIPNLFFLLAFVYPLRGLKDIASQSGALNQATGN